LGLRILMVDDQPEAVETLRAELVKTATIEAVEVVSFSGFQNAIERLAPNIIVLDLAQGNPADQNTPGLNSFDEIWRKKFCPLVIYTAVPDLLTDDSRLSHPFVKLAKKGSGSEEIVIDRIREFGPHLSALDEAGVEIGRALNQALKEVARRIFESTKDEGQRKDMLVRSARRRVAAAMDEELSTGGPNLRSWEHYLCPPANSGHLLTGDIIRKRAGDPRDPSQYAVVLTPSCDLVANEGRKPKVDKALVAVCTEAKRLLVDLAIDINSKRQKIRERLLPMLRQGHGSTCLPLPQLPGEFPTMAADFQKLELINLNEIGNENEAYVRIASVDNPFRELVAWAYIMNAARPGLPDRDFESWVEEIITVLPQPEKRVS
jgi:DNA-binding NarL/FixJ family response regulator